MALSKRKTTVAVLRSILGPIHGQETRFARLAGRSPSWVKKVSAGHVPLQESTARLLELETGISLAWLMGPPDAPPVNGRGDPYTHAFFEWHHSELKAGRRPITSASEPLNYAPAIAAIGSSAGDRGKASIFTWRLKTFLEQCAEEFGFDKDAHTEVWSRLQRAVKKAPRELGGIFYNDKGFDFDLVRAFHRRTKTASKRSSRSRR